MAVALGMALFAPHVAHATHAISGGVRDTLNRGIPGTLIEAWWADSHVRLGSNYVDANSEYRMGVDPDGSATHYIHVSCTPPANSEYQTTYYQAATTMEQANVIGLTHSWSGTTDNDVQLAPNIVLRDVVPPKLTYITQTIDGQPVYTVWVNRRITMTFGATDQGVGLKQYGYQLSSGGGPGPEVLTTQPVQLPGEGLWAVRYRAYDLDGNVSLYSDVYNLRIDLSPPTVFYGYWDDYPVGSAVPLTVTDNLSGVDKVYWRWDDTTAYTLSSMVTVPSSPGWHRFYAYAVDNVGNTSPLSQQDVYVRAAPLPPTNVYRFYNKKNGSHFYTPSQVERDGVIAKLSATYSLDGVAYRLDPAYATPLHRFFNTKNGSHFYTMSEAEKKSVIANLSAVYTYEGPTYKVSATHASGSTAVYRFFNKKNGTHFYTASEAEKKSVIANLSGIYSLDGVAFYVLP